MIVEWNGQRYEAAENALGVLVIPADAHPIPIKPPAPPAEPEPPVESGSSGRRSECATASDTQNDKGANDDEKPPAARNDE